MLLDGLAEPLCTHTAMLCQSRLEAVAGADRAFQRLTRCAQTLDAT